MANTNMLSVSSRGEQGMKTEGSTSERRVDERFPVTVTLTVQELSRWRKTPLAKSGVRGVIFNVSKNGIGISTAAPLTYATVVRCDVAVKNLPVSIPTLAQVRWVQRSHGGEYRSGLTYLL